ncbi:MAG: CheR family methyltransferase [Marivita sp.]|uniref:CheR family methyltransferase n=1 Tax=Marivita sp. TaxID=2003365 RepID=UPI003EFA98F2
MNVDTFTEKLFPVVGIGASAGGLEAIGDFLDGIAPRTGAAYVIVQHLAPDKESILHSLLQRHTVLPITQIVHNEMIKPDHVYIVPPGKVASLKGDMLQLDEFTTKELRHRPIDSFFSSLARARGRDSYCVILSGTGVDGADGLKAIKAFGGFAFVQPSADARFPGMPDNAVATGLVDFVLPADKIPEQIFEILTYRLKVAEGDEISELSQEIANALPAISKLLFERVGHDFSNYKPRTLIRRIERRMNALRTATVEEFMKAIDNDQDAELLASEFMIGVTQFFRDPKSFAQLNRSVIKPLVERKDSNIRIWVPGCATGEEVYSIAMLVLEQIEKQDKQFTLQVFGTDIDVQSLIRARFGDYSEKDLASVTQARRKRFFTRDGARYRISQQVRDACVFTPHNVLQDPPFSRLDLISCRNLLIYFDTEIQRSVIRKFHFALNNDGGLFLGSSESVSTEDNLFHAEDKLHRIFQKNETIRSFYSSFDEPTSQIRALMAKPPLKELKPGVAKNVSLEARVEREFLRHHAPPFAVLSKSGDVLYVSQQMIPFVRPAQGAPSTMISTYLAQELRLPVREALNEVAATGKKANRDGIIMISQLDQPIYDIVVSPSENDFTLILSKVRLADNSSDVIDAVKDIDYTRVKAQDLENAELRRQLADTLQDAESSSQDLMSINEELMSINEEMQSSNEELETSREELQSINEELETVNSELQENNRLLVRANSDLKNLFEATDIAVLFLDREFCVRNYTPTTKELFGLRSRDIGRPIADLASALDYPDLVRDAQAVDKTLQPISREVVIAQTKQTFQVSIKPYRTTDNRLDGYAISFVDITGRKNIEKTLVDNKLAMERQYAELSNLYDTTPVGLSLLDRNRKWLRINEAMAQINGFPPEDHIGKTFGELLPNIDDSLKDVYTRVFDTGEPVLSLMVDGETPASPGASRKWIADFYPVMQDDYVFAVGACVREITEEARMLEQVKAQNKTQKFLLGELQHRVKNTLSVVSSLSKLLLKGMDDPIVYQERLDDRLLAISRTHDILTSSNWSTAKFSDIIHNEALPFQGKSGQRVRLSGPDIELNPEQALSVGMGIHELVTNAVKYGALSNDAGTVYVASFIREEGDKTIATIEWQEYGGPKIKGSPSETGFGTLLINRVLRDDLSADVTLEFPEGGVQFKAEFEVLPAHKA